jgi:hypothetical protein
MTSLPLSAGGRSSAASRVRKCKILIGGFNSHRRLCLQALSRSYWTRRLSIARVKSAEQKGIRVIGLFLGEDEEELRTMKLLFPRLIVTVLERLPKKLGSMLISLA